jgi:aspartokinase
MSKIRLGGVKILEGCSQLTARGPQTESVLSSVCLRVAGGGVNLSHLTCLADSGSGLEHIALCTKSSDAFSTYFLMKLEGGSLSGVCIREGISILSVFPHEGKPQVAGALLSVFARSGIPLYGLAGSPSALSVLVSHADLAGVIDGLFEVFEFPTYRSPYDWHAAYEGREEVFREVICSYKEQIIKVYNIASHPVVTTCTFHVEPLQMVGVAQALTSLGELSSRMVFVVAESRTDQTLNFHCCFSSSGSHEVESRFKRSIPTIDFASQGTLAVFSLVGPHFGDRHGVAHALMDSLRSAGVHPKALACAVSSLSVLVSAEDLQKSIASLNNAFEVPAS